jgi:hypothetical protein
MVLPTWLAGSTIFTSSRSTVPSLSGGPVALIGADRSVGPSVATSAVVLLPPGVFHGQPRPEIFR